MVRDIFVRTLGNQVTVYDKEGNVLKMIPEPPANPPKVTYFNIVEFENKLMGITFEDEMPDYFIDLETDERFQDITENAEYKESTKTMEFRSKASLIIIILCILCALVFTYLI